MRLLIITIWLSVIILLIISSILNYTKYCNIVDKILLPVILSIISVMSPISLIVLVYAVHSNYLN